MPVIAVLLFAVLRFHDKGADITVMTWAIIYKYNISCCKIYICVSSLF